MARYDTFKYGDGTKYGTTTTTANLWTCEIDWFGAGWDGASEADRMVDLSITRGRGYLLNSNGNGFQRVQPGRATITLDNYDRRYDPYNTSSPLYGYILPGKNVRIRVKDGTSGTLWYVFTGYIDDIRPISGREQVLLVAVDRLENLNNVLVQHNTVETTHRTDDAVKDILEDVGITSTEYEIDQMADAMSYWWVDQKIAINAIGELEDAVLGTFFISNDGIVKFYARRRPGEATVLSLESSDILREVTLAQPWDTVRNQVEMVVNPRVLQASATLFSVVDAIPISAGESLELWASYVYDNQSIPALNVGVTQPSSDFKVTENDDGTGADYTTDCTLTVTAFSESAKLEITNNGASGGYISALNVIGEPLTAPNPIIIRDTDATSIAQYGTRQLRIDSKWLQNANDAIDRTSLLLDLLSTARKNPTVRIQARPDIQFSIDLFDRISLKVDYLGIDFAYRIGSIEHTWMNDNGQSVMTSITLEPIIDVSETGYWVFPTLLGETSILA